MGNQRPHPGGNVHHGDVISHKNENSYVYAESGLGDYRRREGSGGGADQRRRALIADRHAVQDVKKVVEKIKADGRHEHHMHREVARPVGQIRGLIDRAGERYQVKRIKRQPPGRAVSADAPSPRAG